MPQKFIVRGSLLPGQPFYCRAGRGWGTDGKLIEVIDQDECPTVPNRVPGLPDVPDPVKVGRKAYAILLKDPRISIKPEGADSAEALASQVPALQAALDECTSENGRLRNELEIAKAETAHADASWKASLDESNKDRDALKRMLDGLTGERNALKEKVTSLESLLGDATKPVEVKPESVKKTESDKKGNAPKA